MKRTKQITGILLSLILILGIFPPISAQAGGNVIIYVSSSSVNVGDTVKVTAKATGPNGEDAVAKLEFKYDSGKLSFVSCSDSNYAGGDGTVVANGNTVSITLKATESGIASVTASGSQGVSSSDGSVSFGDLTAGGTKLTVNNAAGGNEGQEDGGDNSADNANKSEDNSLASLKISPGTLSPAFQYSVTEYTASVGDDVNSITVDAKTSNDKATVESITGHENLKSGKNTVSIVVKAENGVTATYKIIVTKGGGETAAQPEETPAEDGGQTTQEGITINGHPFNLGAAIPEDIIPQDFTKTTVTCKGQQVEGLQFGKTSLTLVYLTTPSTEVKNTLAVYDEASGEIYPFRKVAMGEKYVILLNPPAETGLDARYTPSTAVLEGFENVPVFVMASAESEAGEAANPEGTDNPEAANPEGTDNPEAANPETGTEAKAEEFSLVYGVSNFGNKGWYQYDTKEGTFQRYIPTAAVQEAPQESENPENSVEMQGLQNAYKDLEEKFDKKNEISRKTTAVMIFFLAVLLIVIVNLLLRGRRRDDWEDEDILQEEPKKKPRKRVSGESDWDDDFPDKKSRKQTKKRKQEEDDWEDEFPKEKSPKVKKRVSREDDWEDEFPKEKSSRVKKHVSRENDWEDDFPKEKPKAGTKVSQETRPMVKPEISPKPENTIEKKETIPEDDFEVIDLEDL